MASPGNYYTESAPDIWLHRGCFRYYTAQRLLQGTVLNRGCYRYRTSQRLLKVPYFFMYRGCFRCRIAQMLLQVHYCEATSFLHILRKLPQRPSYPKEADSESCCSSNHSGRLCPSPGVGSVFAGVRLVLGFWAGSLLILNMYQYGSGLILRPVLLSPSIWYAFFSRKRRSWRRSWAGSSTCWRQRTNTPLSGTPHTSTPPSSTPSTSTPASVGTPHNSTPPWDIPRTGTSSSGTPQTNCPPSGTPNTRTIPSGTRTSTPLSVTPSSTPLRYSLHWYSSHLYSALRYSPL